jgi:iron complex transport system substrate-binding protein
MTLPWANFMEVTRSRRRAIALLALLVLACGRRVRPGSVGGTPSRVVSLSPNTTETLFAIGAGDRTVGRSRFCDYPPEVKRLPVVGGYADPSLEAIVALKPDLVVGARGPTSHGLADRLAALGIPTLFAPTESMAEIDAMIDELGKKLELGDSARQVVARSRRRREEVARAIEREPRVRVLLVFGTTPIVVAGPDSFPDEMLSLANGQNVVTSGKPYTTLGAERLVALEPDVILDASTTGSDERRSGIGPDEPGWRELDAVRKGRVVAIRDDAALRPGPRIGDGLAVIARAIHPHASVP